MTKQPEYASKKKICLRTHACKNERADYNYFSPEPSISPTYFTSFTLMTAMNGSPPPSTGSCLAVTAADTDEHRRYFLNSADLIHRILQQLDGRPVSSIQIVTREGSTSTSVSYPLAASVPSLAVLSSPLEAPSGSALISLAAAPASPAAPTPTPAARSSPVAAPPKVAVSCPELTRMQV